MHLSQLLACTLLLTLLSLWTSEAKPGFPQKGPRTPLGEVSVVSHAEGGQKKRNKTPVGGGITLKGDRSRLLRDLLLDAKSRLARSLRHDIPRKDPAPSFSGISFGHKRPKRRPQRPGMLVLRPLAELRTTNLAALCSSSPSSPSGSPDPARTPCTAGRQIPLISLTCMDPPHSGLWRRLRLYGSPTLFIIPFYRRIK